MIKKTLLILCILIGINVHATDYYVSTKGNNSNTGLNESKAWRTLTYAVSKVKAGDIIWVKAGNYGKENIIFNKNGTATNPIQIIGYKNKPGDIKTMYFKYAKGKDFNISEMPTFNGGNRKNSTGFDLEKRSYITIKNIQIKNYLFAIEAFNGANNLTFENVLIKNIGDTNASGVGFRFNNNDNHHNIFNNCTVINASTTAFFINGNFNVIKNCKSYTDENDTILDNGKTMDYHVAISGSNNVVKGHYAEHVGNLIHTGHGISLKASEIKTENNLVEDCDIININGSIEFRHRNVKNNLVRNIRIKGKDSRNSGGLHFRDGASNNIAENIFIDSLKNKNGEKLFNKNGAISFYDSTEDEGTQYAADNNLVRNVIISNSDLGIRLGNSSKKVKNHKITNNKIINCTFYKLKWFIRDYSKTKHQSNTIQNSIISNVEQHYYNRDKPNNWLETNNNYVNNKFTAPTNNGNISKRADFVNPAKNNFNLKPSSLCIDAGKNTNEVKDDIIGTPRPQGKTTDIGAYEFKQNIKVVANAGKDVRTCAGNKVILTASGGDTYKWSTGETTKSISVLANATTKEVTKIYTVTAYIGNSSDSDTVKVTAKPKPNVNLGKDITIKKGKKVTLSSNVKGKKYTWYEGKKKLNYTSSSISVSPNKTTSYKLVVKGFNGCPSGDWIKVNVANSNNAREIGVNNTKVYPNPTDGIVHIAIKDYSGVVTILVSDADGLLLHHEKIAIQDNKLEKTLDLSQYAKGIYFLKVESKQGDLVKKVILN